MSTTGMARATLRLRMNWKLKAINLGMGILPFLVLLLLWQRVATSGAVPAHWLPAPRVVWESAVELMKSGDYLRHVSASITRVLVGFVVSLVFGVSLGVLLGLKRGLAAFFEPLTSFMNALSGIAWIPLAITWFGVGPVAVTFILWNTMFFLILLNTLVGVKSVPRTFEHAVLTLGGHRWHLVIQVLLPGALPNIVNGIRMGMGFGWRAVIAAEMVAASSGLGYMIFNASYYHRADIIIVGIITIGIIWLVTDRLLLVPLERRTVERWGLISRQK